MKAIIHISDNAKMTMHAKVISVFHGLFIK